MIFIETPTFQQSVIELDAEAELAALQLELIANPRKGKLIIGSGGLRKVRMAKRGGGKSGGYRVIYYLVTDDRILLVTLYAKTKRENLTKEQIQRLKQLIS